MRFRESREETDRPVGRGTAKNRNREEKNDMMRCGEIISRLDKLAPESCACSWDNPGLLAGRAEKEVSKILIALDATDEVVETAVREGCGLLLTHHPLIFQPVKKINDQDFIGRRLVKLIQADVSYYAMHTNFDAAPGCMADLAAERMGLKNTVPLEILGQWPDTGRPYGIGVCGELEEPLTLEETALLVKERFGLPFVNVYGKEQLRGKISRAAICPGSGKGMAGDALALGAQVLITGDIGHHDGIDAVAQGLGIIDGGHYGLEHIFMDFMKSYIRENIDPTLTVIMAPPAYPAEVL